MLALDLVIKKYEDLFKKNPHALRNAIPSEDIWRFFVDGDDQKWGWLPYEKREKNYLLAMVRTFDFIFDFSATLDNDYIKSLFLQATSKVEGLCYDSKKNIDRRYVRGEFRSHPVCLGLEVINTSQKGLEELLTKINNSVKYLNRIDYQPCTRTEEKEASRIKSIANIEEQAKCLYEYIKYNNATLICQANQMQIEEEMARLSTVFQSNFLKAKTQEEKLRTIVRYVQDCEQLHGSADCNCRVFCMLLLNHLLMKNGFPPVILHDPNRFDAFSVNELVDMVVKGMENTFYLIENKVLFDVASAVLYKKCSSDEQHYFADVKLIESENRKKRGYPELSAKITIKKEVEEKKSNAIAKALKFGMFAGAAFLTTGAIKRHAAFKR